LQESIEFGVFGLRRVSDPVRLGVGMALPLLLASQRLGADVLGVTSSLAADVFRQLCAFALIIGDLFISFANDAAVDFLTNRLGIAQAPQAHIDQLNAVFSAGDRCQLG